MKFSIVIPLYNKQDSIRRAIYSVFDQVGIKAGQCEIVIVDDGSSDKSLAIVNQIQRQHSDRQIIVYSQTNAGVSAARNKGVELASADYVALLDGDDSYEPNFLSEIESLVSRFPEALMFATGYRFVDSNVGAKREARIVGLEQPTQPQLLADYFSSAAEGDLPVTSSSVCINKFALTDIGGFPRGENMGEDQAVWSQIALVHSIAFSPKVCANYFEATACSLMSTVAPSDEMPFSKRLQQQLDHSDVLPHQVASVEKYIAGHLLDLVRRNLYAGDIPRAQTLLSDRRARSQAKRWLYWSLRVEFSNLINACRDTLSNGMNDQA